MNAIISVVGFLWHLVIYDQAGLPGHRPQHRRTKLQLLQRLAAAWECLLTAGADVTWPLHVRYIPVTYRLHAGYMNGVCMYVGVCVYVRA